MPLLTTSRRGHLLSTTPHRRVRRALLTAILLSVATLCGCFLFPSKKSGKKKGSAELIERESIYVDRVGDGTSAILKFRTTRPASCELNIYSQDENVEPKKDSPRQVACSATAPTQEFSEQLKDLRADVLYFIAISVWPEGSTRDFSTTLVVKEQPGGSNATGEGQGDGKFRSLVVARFNAPVRTAEIHRYSFPEPADMAQVRARIVRTEGCAGKVPELVGPFTEADPDIKLTNLETRGFAAGAAAAHPNFPERMRMYFNALQFGNPEWEWAYKTGDASHLLKSRSAARFTGVEVASNAKQVLGEAQLARGEDPLSIDASRPLRLSWQWENLPDLAWVTTQIGRSDDDKGVYCTFEAKRGTGEIPAPLLSALRSGRHRLVVQLDSTQLLATKGWLIRSVDWRSTRIDKQ